MKKIYLNTIEDFTKALKDDKIVYAMDEFCDGKSKLKLINNILIRKDADGDISIGGHIIFKENVFYIEEKEPIKLELGKLYKTRDGRKVICYYVSIPNCGTDTFYIMEIGKCINPKRYEVYIRGNKYDLSESQDDIVDYWED